MVPIQYVNKMRRFWPTACVRLYPRGLSVIVGVLQNHHVHAQTAQVAPEPLQHVVAHHPQLVGGEGGGRILGGLLATQEAFLCVTARGADPLSPLTFLNGQRQ